MKRLRKLFRKIFKLGVRPNKHLVEREIEGVGFVSAPDYMCQPHHKNVNL